eukprot:10645667-Prorocentrum_lima.AAC.1
MRARILADSASVPVSSPVAPMALAALAAATKAGLLADPVVDVCLSGFLDVLMFAGAWSLAGRGCIATECPSSLVSTIQWAVHVMRVRSCSPPIPP